MAQRYVIAVSAVEDCLTAFASRTAVRLGFDTVFSGPGIEVLADGGVLGLGSSGVVIGDIFAHGPPSTAVHAFSETQIDALRRSRGRSLLNTHWGGYVAVIVGEGRGHAEILRDPTGTMPSVYTSASDTLVVASDLDTLAAAAGISVEVAWPSLVRYLAAPLTIDDQTCIASVTELLPGHSLHVGRSGPEAASHWSPWDHVALASGRSREERAHRLRVIVADTIAAWTGRFEHLVLGISGGLDSSILAASVPDGPRKLSCITMVGPDALGDERYYAEQVANALGLPLHPHWYSADEVAIGRSSCAHMARPDLPYFFQSMEAAHLEIAAARPIEAYLTGSGGDTVFCSTRSVAPIVDRYQVEGIGPGVWRSVRDISEITETPLLTVARLAIRRLRSPAITRSALTQAFLSRHCDIKLSATKGHPWRTAPPGALPGKAAHIAMIVQTLRNLECYPRASHGPQLAPLLSQPVIEECLGIPSWMWCEGGINRSLAREAFSDLLPDEILRRTTKGGPTGFVQRLFESKRGEIRDLLSEGQLAQQGVIDMPAIEAALGDGTAPRGDLAIQILRLAGVEAWTQSVAARN